MIVGLSKRKSNGMVLNKVYLSKKDKLKIIINSIDINISIIIQIIDIVINIILFSISINYS